MTSILLRVSSKNVARLSPVSISSCRKETMPNNDRGPRAKRARDVKDEEEDEDEEAPTIDPNTVSRFCDVSRLILLFRFLFHYSGHLPASLLVQSTSYWILNRKLNCELNLEICLVGLFSILLAAVFRLIALSKRLPNACCGCLVCSPWLSSCSAAFWSPAVWVGVLSRRLSKVSRERCLESLLDGECSTRKRCTHCAHTFLSTSQPLRLLMKML